MNRRPHHGRAAFGVALLAMLSCGSDPDRPAPKPAQPPGAALGHRLGRGSGRPPLRPPRQPNGHPDQRPREPRRQDEAASRRDLPHRQPHQDAGCDRRAAAGWRRKALAHRSSVPLRATARAEQRGADFTIRELLNHTSGIPEFDKEPRVLAPYLHGNLGYQWPPRRLVQIAVSHKSLFAPGASTRTRTPNTSCSV